MDDKVADHPSGSHINPGDRPGDGTDMAELDDSPDSRVTTVTGHILFRCAS